MTALYIAAQEDHTEIAALLLRAGAAVNQAEKGGAPPMPSRATRRAWRRCSCSPRTDRRASSHRRAARRGGARRRPRAPPRHLASGSSRAATGAPPSTTSMCPRCARRICCAAAPTSTPPPPRAGRRRCARPGDARRGHAPAGSAKRLILEAARPWNIDNHRLFPDDGARARRRVRLDGPPPARRLLAGRSRAEVTVFLDVWRGCIVPRVVGRRGGGGGAGDGHRRGSRRASSG